MIDPTVSGLLIAAVTALAGVVTFLWKQISEHHKHALASKAECEEDRERLWGERDKLWAEVVKCNELHDHTRGHLKLEEKDV